MLNPKIDSCSNYLYSIFVYHSLKPSSLLRSSGPPSPGVSSQSGISKTGQSAQTVDINVDFELDVMVNIDSGQCVLHPKESKAEQDAEGRK